MFAAHSPYHSARRNQRRSSRPASTSSLAIMSNYTRAPMSRSSASIGTLSTNDANTPRAASPASTLTTTSTYTRAPRSRSSPSTGTDSSDGVETPRATSPAPSYRTVETQQPVRRRSLSPAPSYRTTDPRLSGNEPSHLETSRHNNLDSISGGPRQESSGTGIFSNKSGPFAAIRARLSSEKTSRELIVAIGAGKLRKVESMLSTNPSAREALLSNGVPSQRSGMIFTPLQMAAVRGNLEIALLLLEYGADIDGRGTGGSNALCSALSFQRDAMVLLLLDHGADVNVRNGPTNRTPLMGASMQGQREMVQLLLQHGADPNAIDDEGKTALDHARQQNRVKVMGMLEQAVSRDDQTPPTYSNAGNVYYR